MLLRISRVKDFPAAAHFLPPSFPFTSNVLPINLASSKLSHRPFQMVQLSFKIPIKEEGQT
ncbi:hypothetical protein FRC03_001284 [Tulasnella sp. 419]|nr:hypothetical protein FRC03_001284 [Tulasnella sp. 419]